MKPPICEMLHELTFYRRNILSPVKSSRILSTPIELLEVERELCENIKKSYVGAPELNHRHTNSNAQCNGTNRSCSHLSGLLYVMIQIPVLIP